MTTAFESQDMDLQIEALRAARALPSPYAAAWVDAGLKHGQLAARVARYKIPRYFVVVEDFPVTPSGKVQKYKLREQFAARRH